MRAAGFLIRLKRGRFMYTTSTALLEAMREAGIEFVFANLGSDHSAIMEAVARERAESRPVPQLITCPNEMVALSAAHGFAQVSGRAQAVLVHVDCGTQALAGAIHNVSKGRVPVLIFAGTTPATQEGELRGSRNEFIHWIQDVFDQRGIVRGYMRYDHEIRNGANIKQIVHRAMQFAYSDPPGPVYLTAAREVLEAETARVEIKLEHWKPVGAGGLSSDAVKTIISALAQAQRPLIVTTYLGRNTLAVAELTRLCDRLGIGVLESVPSHVNYPKEDALYQGLQWNESRQNDALAAADVILVIDSDVPWIPLVNKPSAGARILHIDIDPLKQQMPLWYIPATDVYRADAVTALRQLNEHLASVTVNENAVKMRKHHYSERHARVHGELAHREEPQGKVISPEYLTACVRSVIGEEAIVISEGITNYHHIANHSGRNRPGTYFTSGGGSLGWGGGAAIGAKLARPESLVVCLTGDGSYMFSVPSTVHWMARRYRTPFLEVIYNNRGWAAPKFSTLAVHPDGFASRAADLNVSFELPPDYSAIAAAAGGAYAETVRRPEEVEPALQRALTAVRTEGRAAVIDAWLAHL
jgi:acetolactate synthase I/II/III large subunit